MKLRHELKYAVPLEQASQLFKALESYCVPDPYAGEGGSYEVSSLYYDTQDFRFYWDREESVGFRRKLRLRSYNSEGKSTGTFIEIKEKHKNLVAKKRISVPLSVVEGLDNHHRLSLDHIIDQLPDGAESREVRYLHRTLQLRPIAIVRYVRDTLMSERDKGLRITYDRRLTSGGDDLLRYDPTKESFIHPSSSGILEIKANSGIPLWLQSILTDYGFCQSRFSKYCLAVKCLYSSAPNCTRAPLKQTAPTEEPVCIRAVVGL
jgi:hypothetical protein